MRLHNCTNTNPTVCTSSAATHNLSTGDSVLFGTFPTGGWTALSGTTKTITDVPLAAFYAQDSSLTSVNCAGSPPTCTVTTASAPGSIAGQYVVLNNCGSNMNNVEQPYQILTVPTSTTFTFQGASGSEASMLPNCQIFVQEAFTIPVDATGFGAFADGGLASATMTPTSNTINFGEIQIQGTGGAIAAPVFGGNVRFGGAVIVGGHP